MTDYLQNFGEIILCVYAVVKHLTKSITPKNDGDNTTGVGLVVDILRVVIALVVYALLALLILPFLIFRKLLDLYLRNKYGDQYNGILHRMDAIWLAETKQTLHIIHGIMLIEAPVEKFITQLKRRIKESRNTRFNSTLHNFLGYWYRLRSDVAADEAIKYITLTASEIADQTEFEKKVSALASQPLPPNSAYEILVSAEPVQFYKSKDPGAKSCVAILRLHHSMGDGVNLLHYLMTLADEQHAYQVNSETPTIFKAKTTNSENKTHMDSKSKWMNSLNAVMKILKSASMYHFMFWMATEDNVLHRPALSGEKLLIFDIEEGSEYVSKIKSIKNRLTDCKFTDVLYTALSASLRDYFSEHGTSVPENIQMAYISSWPRKEAKKNDEVQSEFAATIFYIPVRIEDEAPENLTSRLEIIRDRNKMAAYSIDRLFFYWIISHCGILPTPIIRTLSKLSMNCTIAFSNIPGAKPVKIGGQDLHDIVMWMPNVGSIGVGVVVKTYGNRLKISITADKIVLLNQKEASVIIKNIYKYIDLMYNEINSKE